MSFAAHQAFIGGTLGGGEILLVFVAILLLFGSKNLPRIARSLGRAVEEFRRAAREVSSEILSADDTPAPRRTAERPAKTQPPDAQKDANERPPAG